MMTTKAELKTFFKNGDVPGQEQFWTWMDSYWHKEEAIDAESTLYTNPKRTQYQVGGVPIGTSFDRIPIREVLDFILYGKPERTLAITTSPPDAVITINGVVASSLSVYEGANITYTVERPGYFSKTATVKVTEDMTVHVALEPDLSNTEIKFKIRTSEPNQEVPIAMLRTSDTQTLAKISYGDGQSNLVSVPEYNGSESWTDNEGNVHHVDNGNTFYHVYETVGDYEISINAGANVSYVRFCEGLTSDPQGYLSPTVNNFVQEISVFRSDSITNLDYTFAGLSLANVTPGFKLETPEATTLIASFYGFGAGREFESFPAAMLSLIRKPTVLRGTFFKAGLKKILPGFLDSLTELQSVFECFKNSKLGKGYYNGVDAGQFPTIAVQGSDDFVPVSLFWNNAKLTDISHAFNYIGEGWFGNLSSGYLAYFIIRSEIFWNGKTSGNAQGTIVSAFYAFGKCNRILCEPNILKHAPAMVYIGGMFTQTNTTQHAVGWGTMIPVAASESTVYQFSENAGNYTAVAVPGKGLTFDLSVMFPEAAYPKITCISGAFTAAATGDGIGFQHPIDYTPNGLPAKLDLSISGADFLAKFPNANAGSIDDYAKLILGQSGGTDSDKNDGRHGVFHLLDQDDRIRDKATLPSLVFNNAIAY
ncbi:PEGA domain-containing protein [Sphingobacterium paludis]|uniref:PEGA domain-containing protein n=1 Tax=Sphingobacterium paludis TaxID=1476465 RepID=A0A4R7DA17_9SPHI|nr:PEGA domain-containing protein [Sphingobacterium paludis]TDS17647.1 hypothetical protein B0I21_101518 [Sphingobacterium paludis]